MDLEKPNFTISCQIIEVLALLKLSGWRKFESIMNLHVYVFDWIYLSPKRREETWISEYHLVVFG